jgi:serine/threonine protein kinase
MEYVDGKDVRTLLDRHRAQQKPIPPEHVAWVGMEVANALQAAHTQRDQSGRPLHIVHRDVSPSNVLLSYRGEVKLCDFGIAKAATTRVQTKTGVIKGKVKYMSPEQAMGRKLDHRSDLFSLGTVLYEMLTLAAPFSAATEVELIFAVRDARKADARTVEPGVPEAFDTLLNKLMSRSRSQRFQSGGELAQALRAFLDRHYPGYRRSHFARFMRGLFEADIEQELRQLEEYIIDGGDPEKVGENLIADALGQDAPYTQFTAATGGPRVEQTEDYSARLSTLGADLHSEETRILQREAWRPGPPQSLNEQSTRILDRARPRLHEEPTGPKTKVSIDDLHAQPTRLLDFAGGDSLHAQETRILQRPEESDPGGLAAQETRILPRRENGDQVDSRAPTLPAEDVVGDTHPPLLLDDDMPETTAAARPVRQRRDTVPEPPEGEVEAADDEGGTQTDAGAGARGVVVEEDEADADESTAVPLGEEDLEPPSEH